VKNKTSILNKGGTCQDREKIKVGGLKGKKRHVSSSKKPGRFLRIDSM